MKRFIRIVVVVLLGVGAVALYHQDRIARLLAVNSLFDADRITHNFSNMDAAFLHEEVSRGDGPVSELPKGPPLSLTPEQQNWVEQADVTAIVMLQNGKLRHESYYKDTTAEDRRISWSVAKSFISVLMGIALDEGAIDSIDDSVIKYAPSLMDSAYAGASIEDVLLMSSGVTFDEDYLDPSSDINKMGRVLALGRSMDAFTADLTETFQPAGSAWQYVSIDTHVLGMVLRGATGKSIPALLSEKVVASLGLEAAPYYVTDGYGTAFVLGGLNMRTRDYARFGQMVLQDGKHNGRQIVPADWLRQSTVPLAETKAGAIQYGYQWWIPADAQEGEFMARGIYGQYIYINRNTQTVIALNGAHRGFREEGVFDRNMAVLRQLATQ